MNLPVFALLYLFTIFITNLGFSVIHPIDVGFGLFSPMAIVAGAVFVVRDYAQREVGSRKVLLYMVAGATISYLMVDPYIAIASMVAFIFAELVDWAVYTLSKFEFHKRILLSSLLSTPVDTIVFLWFIDIFTPATFALMVLSKLLVAVLLYRKYEAKQATAK